MTQTPLLIISDHPNSGTGLGRITRDLATRINEHMQDDFYVGTLGYGGAYTRSLQFPQYTIEGMHDWILPTLPDVWKDFAGKEPGIVMSIWDASRMLWFARSECCHDQVLQTFLKNARFKKWGYMPVDATGPHNRLTAVIGHTMAGYDRVLAYSKWAAEIIANTLTASQIDRVDFLPHGIDTSVFKPRPRKEARRNFGVRIKAKNQKGRWIDIPDNCFLIGIVATNQMRKDYGLGLQVVAEIAKGRNAMVWIHTDVLERHWSIPSLLNDYGLEKKHIVTLGVLSDEDMAWCYSACDVTLGIGNFEGFGYPIFESLACGTPCIHGNSGGAAEHMDPQMLVEPAMYRLEGVYNCMRGVHRIEDWEQAAQKFNSPGQSLLPAHLDWNNLWPKWEQWFRDGISPADEALRETAVAK